MFRYYLYVWLDRYQCYWLIDTYSFFQSAKHSIHLKKHPNNDYVCLKKTSEDKHYNHVLDYINHYSKSYYRVWGALHG